MEHITSQAEIKQRHIIEVTLAFMISLKRLGLRNSKFDDLTKMIELARLAP